MSLFALPIAEPFWLLLAGLLFLFSSSLIQLRLARKSKAERSETN
jgi:hypothetical protein